MSLSLKRQRGILLVLAILLMMIIGAFATIAGPILAQHFKQRVVNLTKIQGDYWLELGIKEALASFIEQEGGCIGEREVNFVDSEEEEMSWRKHASTSRAKLTYTLDNVRVKGVVKEVRGEQVVLQAVGFNTERKVEKLLGTYYGAQKGAYGDYLTQEEGEYSLSKVKGVFKVGEEVFGNICRVKADMSYTLDKSQELLSRGKVKALAVFQKGDDFPTYRTPLVIVGKQVKFGGRTELRILGLGSSKRERNGAWLLVGGEGKGEDRYLILKLNGKEIDDLRGALMNNDWAQHLPFDPTVERLIMQTTDLYRTTWENFLKFGPVSFLVQNSSSTSHPGIKTINIMESDVELTKEVSFHEPFKILIIKGDLTVRDTALSGDIILVDGDVFLHKATINGHLIVKGNLRVEGNAIIQGSILPEALTRAYFDQARFDNLLWTRSEVFKLKGIIHRLEDE